MMNKSVVMFGVFDLTHYGHYSKFKLLKEKGYDVVHVGVVSDEFAASYKRKPILTEQERMDNVASCRWVNGVFLTNGNFTLDVDVLRPNAIAIGNDWDKEKYMKHMGFSEELFDKLNIELIFLPYTEGISTTKIIERIREDAITKQ